MHFEALFSCVMKFKCGEARCNSRAGRGECPWLEVVAWMSHGKIVNALVMICMNFGPLQYPMTKRVVLIDVWFTDKNYTRIVWV